MAEFKSTGDPETDEVLRQMAEEGQPLPEFGKPDEVEEVVEEVEEEVEEQTEVVEEDDEPEEEYEDRKPRSVPREKYEYLQEKKKKLEARIKELENQPKKTEVDDEIKKFAEEQNLDIDAAYKLAELVSKKAIPDDLRQSLEDIQKERADKTFWKSQYEQYEDEFEKSLAPIIKRDNPKISKSELRDIAEKMRKEAFEGDNASKSLVQLYLSKPKQRVSGEPTTVRSIPKNVALEDITAEDIDAMSPEEFEEFSNNLGNKSPKLTR